MNRVIGFYNYEQCYAHYTKRIMNIRQAKIHGERIVAKPVLMVAIIDGIEANVFQNNRFVINDWLEERYNMLMQKFTRNSQFDGTTGIEKPFWHLESDGDKNGNHEMDTCVFECTADSFMYRINNSLTDFHYRYHRARPLRVRTDNGFRLLTDKNYKINSYTLGYLEIPEEITNKDPYKNYGDFEDYTWQEIVKIAAQMYIENQADPRYKTLTQEVLTQE